MPELPELECLRKQLKPLIIGKRIREFKILKPYVLRSCLSSDLSSEVIEDIARRGKYLVFLLTSHNMYVHLMLHGSIRHISSLAGAKKSANALLVLEDGTIIEFSEKTAKKRMAIHIKQKDDTLGSLENLGLEPLSEEFTVHELSWLLKSGRKQLKTFLCRQSKIAGIGNAYADEILWRAGLSPFKSSTQLNQQEIEQLYRSIIETLKWAIQNVGNSASWDRRDFLQIYGKKGHPCPRCGDVIRTISYAQNDTFYCPKCQTRGIKLKDRRMSKFYR